MHQARIYGLVDPLTHEMRWVGKCSMRYLCSRLAKHICAAKGRGRPLGCTGWVAGLLAQGIRPEIVALEDVPKGSGWIEAEQFWIESLRALGCRLLNLSVGGYATTKEGRQATADKLSGRPRPEHVVEIIRSSNRGRKVSAETRAKISAAKVGTSVSLDVRAKISAANKGKPKPPRSAEHARRISEARKGKPGRAWTPEQRARLSATRRASFGLQS
jgi:hypothetical protein